MFGLQNLCHYIEVVILSNVILKRLDCINKYSTNTGFVKSAHKHVHFWGGLIFNILFSNFEMNMQ